MKQLLKTLFFCFSALTFLVGLTACPRSDYRIGKSEMPSAPVNGSDKIVLKDNFIDVCNGSKIATAAAYEKTLGAVSPVLIFYRAEIGLTFQDVSFDFPKDWTTDYSNVAKNQLVACITVGDRKLKRKCDFEEDKKKYRLSMNDAKYNAKVYEARTGALVAEKDFDLKADKECPMLHLFFSSDETEDPDYEQPVTDFLKPLVKH